MDNYLKSLVIDCSSGMTVSIQHGCLIDSIVDDTQKKHTDELLVAVDNLLKKSDMKLSDIDNLCIAVGPGSFTGIRVAISIAKGLAVANNFKIFTLSNFDLYLFDDEIPDALVLEGFSNNIYVRKFNKNGHIDSCETVEDFSKYVVENNLKNICVENEKTQNLLKKYEIESNIIKKDTDFAFINEIESGNNIQLEQIKPIYLRVSQAELERKKKLENKENE